VLAVFTQWVGSAAADVYYGMELHTHNGRDAVQDLREELLDALQYLAQARAEGRISAPVYVPSLAALVEILAIIGGPTDAP